MNKIPIQVERKGNTRNKLTIGKDRISLKLRDEVDEEGERWLIAFSEKIIEAIPPGQSFTLRGRFDERTVKGKRIYSIYFVNINRKAIPGLSFTSEKMGLGEPKGKV